MAAQTSAPSDSSQPSWQPHVRALLRERWFLWPLALRIAVWLLLAHTYEMAVFQDASRQMAAGAGVYARFAPWLAAAGDGYYAAPPVYAYMLWIAGVAASALDGSWWVHQLLIKSWLLLADLAVMAFLLRRFPAAARRYWTLWFVPVAGIAQVQPDLWVGLSVLAAFQLALQERWWGAGVLLGIGAAVKPTPLLILPFVVALLVRTGRAAAVIPVLLGSAGALAAGWLPYALFFPDLGSIWDVIRFHLDRSVAGLTIPSGVLLITNAGLTAVELAGTSLPWAQAAFAGLEEAGRYYPVVTLGAFLVVLTGAVWGRRWSLPHAFCLPLLVFLSANKVVHEHYLLQVLPLLVALGIPMRGVAIAFSVYLLVAGTPLRYLPSQYGAPTDLEALFPPLPGVVHAVGLAAVTGAAAMAFGISMLSLARSFSVRVSGSDGRLRGLAVVSAGVLVGMLAMAGILLLSGLRVTRNAWDPGREPPPHSPQLPWEMDERNPEGSRRGPGGSNVLAVVQVGPVSDAVATEIVGELTLAGFAATVKADSTEGASLRTIRFGPYPQPTVDVIRMELQKKFPAVRVTVILVK